MSLSFQHGDPKTCSVRGSALTPPHPKAAWRGHRCCSPKHLWVPTSSLESKDFIDYQDCFYFFKNKVCCSKTPFFFGMPR